VVARVASETGQAVAHFYSTASEFCNTIPLKADIGGCKMGTTICADLFDHLVSARKQSRRDIEAAGSRGGQIDDGIEFGTRLD